MKKINFGNKKFPSQYSLKCLFVSDTVMAYCLTNVAAEKSTI